MERRQQLQSWIAAEFPGRPFELAPASADASFRRYFRVTLENGDTRIVMDAPPEHEDCRPFLHVGALFRDAGVHVPEVYAQDLEQGFLLLSDLGSTTYLSVLNADTAPKLYRDANAALVDIQRASRDSANAALKIAQQLGYAETKDPGDDVDGRDACRKIAILASLACGHHVYPDNIPTRGIRDITVADIKAAEKLDSAIKLIAWYNEGGDGQMAAGVEPMLVSNSNQLAGVDDVFNAVLMKGDMLGDVVFYGKGAGKLPTASAVVADVIDALKEGVKVHDSLFWKPAEKPEGMLEDRNTYPWYLRVTGVAAALLPSVAGAGHVVFEDNGEAAYLVDAATSADIASVTEKIEVLGGKVALAMKKLED